MWGWILNAGLLVLVISVTSAGETAGQRLDGKISVISAAGGWDESGTDIESISNVFEVRHRQKRGLMYPGTKWCGDGDNAKDYDDLGSNVKTDRCCRDHDNCPDIIRAKKSKYGLSNNTPYTKLHCDCDEEFRECLKNASNTVSSIVGRLFFDVSKPRCYRLDYPAECWDRDSSTERCLNYTYDTTQAKIWQYFDQSSWDQHKRQHVKVTPETATPTVDPGSISPSPNKTINGLDNDHKPLTSSATFKLGASGSLITLALLVTVYFIHRKYWPVGYEYHKLSTIEDKVSLGKGSVTVI